MIKFHTKNINETTYRRLIFRILYEMYNYDIERVLNFINDVTIEIHSTADTRLDYFQHLKTTSGQSLNPKITSGVAGHYHVRLFLHDGIFNMFKFRENADRIGHEFCHEAYYIKYGSVGNRHVTTVHSRDNRQGKFTFWFYTLGSWLKLPITIIDIRNLL